MPDGKLKAGKPQKKNLKSMHKVMKFYVDSTCYTQKKKLVNYKHLTWKTELTYVFINDQSTHKDNGNFLY